ncbi:PAN domain-containing protein [Neorhizobium sp. CSC1952]|uniref:PAN domain-containing protein n=1 Tax=Neorhizobium sp. CSC1952 TaxID=2978974 RepID=UPI0025A664E9|nr:PAN domain-containing protein [Rhizobium sp. CSC1952]WJR68964.1 PAN domain-containing protein [Rhizobium sp. CSC1952]
MRKLLRSVAAGAVLGVTAMGTPAISAEKNFGPFIVDDAKPDVITMNGDIDVGSALNFRRALHAAPGAKLVILNSPGGTVQMGLLMADDIHERKLATYIPKDSACLSACAYMFLAGVERRVDGKLGVHQISSDTSDLVGAQLTISDIIDLLNRFDTPVDVLSVMFKTPPNDMHVFTPEEIERYKLNRTGEESKPSAVAGPPTAPEINPSPTDVESTPKPAAPGQSQPADTAAVTSTTTPQTQAKLSPIEEFTKRPNRIAIYTGLDLFGDDLSSIRASDAAECAQNCLVMNGQCKAFTFNTNPKITKGPNCFLKSSAGRADGNSVAFSGRFLSGVDADPPIFTLGMIDPESALFHDVDLRGGDLSSRPHRTAKTPLDCRLACVDDNRCLAFTYNYPKKQCWLKSAIGTPMPGNGMVSGVKKFQSFSPAKIISLN